MHCDLLRLATDGGHPSRQYSTLRWLEVEIFSSSRYFAMVRRARTRPSRCRMLTIFESLSGLRGSSFSMIFRMRCLIVTDETLSPYELLMPLWKKYFISNTPCGEIGRASCRERV